MWAPSISISLSILLPAAVFAAPSISPAPAASAVPRIEVAFVLDATGSMGPYIDDARSRIRSIAADLATGEPRPDVHYALVAFRDKGDAFVTRITPFTGEVSVMHQALTALSADGGGDTPEAVLEGLRDAVLKLRWSPVPAVGRPDPVLRLVYVIGDAEPQHYPDSPKESEILKSALARGIAIQSLVCGEPGSNGRAFFDRVAARSEGRSVSLSDRTSAGGGHADGGSAPTVGGAISGTTRTYAADALHVDFAASGTPVPATVLSVPAVETSGLLGAQLRWVSDAATFSDLWRAHTSLHSSDSGGAAPSAPVVDFSKQHVLATGGADAGLTVSEVRPDEAHGVRLAQVRSAEPGVRFYLIPAAPAPVITAVVVEK